MVGRWIYYCGILIGIFISNAQSSEENCNTTTTHIVTTDSGAQKTIEIKNPLNSTPSPVPGIQQGNNLFIKPKFIFGLTLTSHKQVYKKNAEGTPVTSKIPFAEPNIKIEKPEITQLPKILVPSLHPPIPPPPVSVPADVTNDIPKPVPRISPPSVIVPVGRAHYNPIHIPRIRRTPVIGPADVIHDIPTPILGIPPPPINVPTGVAHNVPISFRRIPSPPVIVPADAIHDISIPISRIPIQQQISVAIPDICQVVRCPPKAIPIPHYFPQLPLPYAAHNIPVTNPRISSPPVIIPSGVAHNIPISTQRFPLQPVIAPTDVAHDISIPISRIPIQPQIPITIPDICQLVRCPPKAIPIPHYFPQLPYAAHNIPITNPRISSPPVIIPSGVAHHIPIFNRRFPLQPVIALAGVAHNISIPISRISIQPQVPIAIPNICQLVPCRPNIVPVAPYFPQLQPPPILVEKPRVIREPLNFSQVILPQSPIQVVVQNPTVPMGERIIVSPFCPMVCNSNGNDSNSIASILNDMYQKFKNMMGNSEPTPRRRGNRTTTTESTTEAEEKQSSTSEKNVACPCMSTQGIIIERFVPDTVPNKEIKVYVSTISPPQLAHKDEEHVTPSS